MNTGNHIANDPGDDPRSPYYNGPEFIQNGKCDSCQGEFPEEQLKLHKPTALIECPECHTQTCIEYAYHEEWELELKQNAMDDENLRQKRKK